MQLEEQPRYDIILLTASLPIYEPRFERALRPGGRLLVVVGTGTNQWASLIRRASEQTWSSQPLFETCIETLEGAPRPPAFDF
jgi:protein-L-isoaspartate(D-aspartate) O-methyltransferase